MLSRTTSTGPLAQDGTSPIQGQTSKRNLTHLWQYHRPVTSNLEAGGNLNFTGENELEIVSNAEAIRGIDGTTRHGVER